MKPKDDNSIQSLLGDYFVRDLDDDQLARLETALASNPDLRAKFAEHSRDEWLLHHVHEDITGGYIKPNNLVQFHGNRNFFAKFVAIAAMLAVSCTFAYLYFTHTETDIHYANLDSEAIHHLATLTDAFALPGDSITVINDSETRLLQPGGHLFAGDRVTVPEGARLSFQYANEETLVRINTASEFVLSELNGTKHIHLESGALKAEVVRQPVGKPMRLTTNDAEAVVLGTSFELRAKEYTQLAVLTGRVVFNSRFSEQNVEVQAGHLAKSNQASEWKSVPFKISRTSPIFDHTLNKNRLHEFIAVDHERDYVGFLRFDCGQFNGKPIEAKLKLHLSRHHTDGGGSGTVRLYKVPPTTHINNVHEMPFVEVATYTGRLGAGMDLTFNIDTESMDNDINTFLIKLDENGNDFWFSSSEGPVPPQLILKVDSST